MTKTICGSYMKRKLNKNKDNGDVSSEEISDEDLIKLLRNQNWALKLILHDIDAAVILTRIAAN